MSEDKVLELIKSAFLGLDSNFEQRRKIAFWFDEEGNYKEFVQNLGLSYVKVIELTDYNTFKTKKTIEYDDIESNFLIYYEGRKPQNAENWFLDTLKYSQEIVLDEIQLIKKDLSLKGHSFDSFLTRIRALLKNKERLFLMRDLIPHDPSVRDLEVAAIAVSVGARRLLADEVLIKVLESGIGEDNQKLLFLDKFSLLDEFWELVATHFGIFGVKDIRSLIQRIYLSSIKDKSPKALSDKWSSYSDKSNGANCRVFLEGLKLSDPASFEIISKQVFDDLGLQSDFEEIEVLSTKNLLLDEFRVFDEIFIKRILERIENEDSNHTDLEPKIQARLDMFWSRSASSSLSSYFDSLLFAIRFFSDIRKFDQMNNLGTSYDVVKCYTKSFFNIDKNYRKFCTSFSNCPKQDVFYNLSQKIENIYKNHYLDNLVELFSKTLEKQKGTWPIHGVQQQIDFYQTANEMLKGKNKVYVIISDALRYEVANDLNDRLNGLEIRGNSELSYMQSSLPSITSVGMASLLPCETVNLKINKKIEVSLDSFSTQGTENRNKILQNKESVSLAIQYKDLMRMNTTEVRSNLKDFSLVYIYHNHIDAIGDNPHTEIKALEACNEAVDEIFKCISKITSQISATNVFVTADHGFLFNRRPLEEYEKVEFDSSDAQLSAKRYIVTDEYKDISGAIGFDLSHLGAPDKYVYSPRGAKVFKTQGAGVNFVHGGASPQEVIIPLLKFKGKKVLEQKKVDVEVVNSKRLVTNNKFTVSLFQVQAVDPNFKSRELTVSFWDGDKLISDQKKIHFNSDSSQANYREFKEVLTLKLITYDKNKDYILKLMDDNKPYKEIKFKINIAFVNDFDF